MRWLAGTEGDRRGQKDAGGARSSGGQMGKFDRFLVGESRKEQVTYTEVILRTIKLRSHSFASDNLELSGSRDPLELLP